MSSVKNNAVKGLFWSFLDSFGAYFVKFGFSIAIARALSPDDYGIMGMIVIFIALGQIVMTGGFSMALVQKQGTTDRDYSTVFWYNLGIACLIYCLLFFAAGPIADFYDSPILKDVTRITSLGIIFSSLAVVQVAVLTKRMDFRSQAIINLVSSLVSGIFGVVFAYKGFAVWALVIQTLAGGVAGTLGFWVMSDWRPKFIFDRGSFISLNRYGSKIFFQGLGDVIFTKIYFPLIGKYFSAAQLGYYTNANRFYDIFVRQVSNAFNRVMFPAFSSIQDESERFNRNYLMSFDVLFWFASVVSLVLILAARPFVSVFLTEKWLPAVPLMTVFFIEGFFFPLLMLNQNILCSIGKTGTSLKIDILKKVLTFGSIFIAFRFGIQALIMGQVAGSFIAFAVSAFVVFRTLKVSMGQMFRKAFPVIIITVLCGAGGYLLKNAGMNSDWALLAANISLIPALYLALSFLFRISAIKELRVFIRGYLETRGK